MTVDFSCKNLPQKSFEPKLGIRIWCIQKTEWSHLFAKGARKIACEKLRKREDTSTKETVKVNTNTDFTILLLISEESTKAAKEFI